MDEGWYLERFVEAARDHYPDAFFLDDLRLSSNDDGGCPACGAVRFLVEIDAANRCHLWHFRLLAAPQLRRGDAIGQMFAQNFLLGSARPDELRLRLEETARRKQYPVTSPRFRRVLRKPRFQFDSWNLVICGGKGFELADVGWSELRHVYAPVRVLSAVVNDVNVWHFYRTSTGCDLRTAWDEQAVPGPGARLVAPGDDFDIASKRELHLRRRKGLHREARDAWAAALARRQAETLPGTAALRHNAPP